jgi:hypothetical protein
VKKYRFDDAYSKVYEYDENAMAYIFIGTYYAFGIKTNMQEKEKIEKVESY